MNLTSNYDYDYKLLILLQYDSTFQFLPPPHSIDKQITRDDCFISYS